MEIPCVVRPKTYAPEHPPDPPERAVCTRSERCQGCPYPGHGFLCWHEGGECLRDAVRRILKLKPEITNTDTEGDTP